MEESTRYTNTMSDQKSFIVLMVGLCTLLFGVAVLKLNSTVCLLLSGIISAYLGMAFGCKWEDCEKYIAENVRNMAIGILIMMMVGLLIATWMAAGVVPYLMYYGLKFIPPSIFLVAVCLACALMSIMTGTSWGTIGTIGIAFVGISEGLGIPLPYTIGSIVVGALVGDKLSPLSDTTILAPYVSGCDLIEHIKSMLYTTVPALLISLVLYAFLGMGYSGGGSVDSETYSAILNTLETKFTLNPVLLLPPVLVLGLILKRKPTLPVFGAGIILAIFLAVFVQDQSFTDVMKAAASGGKMDTGNAMVNKMVNRGGLSSIMSSVGLIISAAVFSGALKGAGVFDMLINSIQRFAKSSKTLLFFSYMLHMALCSLTGSYFVTFSVCGPLLGPIFDKYDLNRKNLSRMLEDTGTTFAPLVPWSVISGFILATLNVTSYDYVLYAPLTYMGVIIPMFYIATGFGVFRSDGTMYFRPKNKQ